MLHAQPGLEALWRQTRFGGAELPSLAANKARFPNPALFAPNLVFLAPNVAHSPRTPWLAARIRIFICNIFSLSLSVTLCGRPAAVEQ